IWRCLMKSVHAISYVAWGEVQQRFRLFSCPLLFFSPWGCVVPLGIPRPYRVYVWRHCIFLLFRGLLAGKPRGPLLHGLLFPSPHVNSSTCTSSRVSLELGFFFSMSPSFFLPARASLQIPHLFSPAFPLQP